MRYFVNWVLPGSILFLVGAMAVGVAMLYGRERMRRAGRRFLILVSVFYIFGSTRIGADLILAPLYRHDAFLTNAAGAQGATAIVLFNAGAHAYRAREHLLTGMAREQALRILETSRVYRLLGDPLVIVTGGYLHQTDRPSLGSIYAKALVELGVPAHRIVIEPAAKNTREHAEFLKPYLDKHNVRRFVLVTSPSHMWRSTLVLRAGGYNFVTSAAAHDSELDQTGALTPTEENLERVVLALHEYIGLIYYWWNGWI